ncbi:unnamed protein product [Prunus brigantina]
MAFLNVHTDFLAQILLLCLLEYIMLLIQIGTRTQVQVITRHPCPLIILNLMVDRVMYIWVIGTQCPFPILMVYIRSLCPVSPLLHKPLLLFTHSSGTIVWVIRRQMS